MHDRGVGAVGAETPDNFMKPVELFVGEFVVFIRDGQMRGKTFNSHTG